MTIGDRIREKREKKGLTQVELAEALGITKQAVNSWEKGTQNPSSVILRYVADELECTADYLVGRE